MYYPNSIKPDTLRLGRIRLRLARATIGVFLVVVGISNAVLGQPNQPSFEHLSVDQGLSQSSGRALMQDSRGFIWIGTEDGLNKYDGITFQIYRHDPSDSTSISSNFILRLHEDGLGSIWISTGRGLDKLDVNTNVFQHYQNKLMPEDTEVRCMYEDHDGTLWIGTNRGLNKFDRERDTFIHLTIDSSANSADLVRIVLEENSGVLWVVSGETGLYSRNRGQEKFTRVSIKIQGEAKAAQFISALHADNQGQLWLAVFPVGLLRYDRSSGSFVVRIKEEQSVLGSIAEDQHGNLWIVAGGEGVFRFDKKSGAVTRLRHDPYNPSSLSSNEVVSILVDRANTVWIGTLGGGVNIFDPQKKKFSRIRDVLKKSEAWGRSLIWAVLEDADRQVWIGTQSNGIVRVDRQKGTVSRFTNRSADPHSLSSNLVYALAEDEFGTIWAGTANRGLNALDKGSGRFKRYTAEPGNPSSLSTNGIRRLYADKKGFLWIGTMGRGLSRLELQSGRFTHYVHDSGNPKSIGSNYVSYIFEDKAGVIWLGAEGGGLNKLDPDSRTFTRFQHAPDDPKSLSHNGVMSICEEPPGTLWIGTSHGLNRFDTEREEFTRYTTKDGLPNDVIYGVLPDDQGNLWVSTNKGLSRFDPRVGQFKNYDLEDGLQSREFNSGAFFKSARGEMFFGGVNGVNFFYPGQIKDNPNIPPVLITGLKKFDHPLSLGTMQPLELTYKDNFISFEFVALNYTNPQKNEYQYKLEGLHDDWIHGGNQRHAMFTNLDPGNYIFRVKGSNNDGVWNEEGASIGIVITPPFWQAAWFRVLAAVATLLGLALILWQQKNKARKKAELDKRISELKLQALRAQMNPHFVFNTINSIQYFISSNEKKAAFQYLSKFSKLMRKMLENAEKSTLPISEELDSLRLYLDLELLRFEGKFDYDLEVDPDIDVEDVRIPTMLIQPFVENAIHHGLKFKRSKGALKISLKQQNGSLVCTIEDNGIGIEKALELKSKGQDQHKPTGLKVTRQRLETLNALRKDGQGIEIMDLSRESGSAHGTKVKIVIPVES